MFLGIPIDHWVRYGIILIGAFIALCWNGDMMKDHKK